MFSQLPSHCFCFSFSCCKSKLGKEGEVYNDTGPDFTKTVGSVEKKTSTTEITSERAELPGRAGGREEHPGRGCSAPKLGGRERVQPRSGEAGRDEGESSSSPRWSRQWPQPLLCPLRAWAPSAKPQPCSPAPCPLLGLPPGWGCFQRNVCREENQQQEGGG